MRVMDRRALARYWAGEAPALRTVIGNLLWDRNNCVRPEAAYGCACRAEGPAITDGKRRDYTVG